MPLVHFLYRCPRCGTDPMGGEKDLATCLGCGARFTRGQDGGTICVQAPGEGEWRVPSSRLSAAITKKGGPNSRAYDADGRLSYGAFAEVREAKREDPVWYRGELRGFAERFADPVKGYVRIDSRGLTVFAGSQTDLETSGGNEGLESKGSSTPTQGDNPARGRVLWHWPLLAIRAVQTSSSSVQISPEEGGVVDFRFTEDSPKRWDELLRSAVRVAYREAGRGEIVEFQPRIVTR